MNEINKDFYCSASVFDGTEWCNLYNKICIGISGDSWDIKYCPCYHRKHPTPEQFKEEYGEDVPHGMPVWVLIRAVSKLKEKDGTRIPDEYCWSLEQYARYKQFNNDWNVAWNNMNSNFWVREIVAVCIACTPFVPDADWRPK